MFKTALIIAAPGCEESELVVTADMLRRTTEVNIP
jgi:putative intracellular protease/amidase